MYNWNNIKVNIPGVGERAYVVEYTNQPGVYNPFDGYPCEGTMYSGCFFLSTGAVGQGTAAVNPAYNTTNPSTGGLWTVLPTYPVVGDYVSMGYAAGAGPNPSATGTRVCLKVLARITEAAYLNGWCNDCDVNSIFCPNPPGCAYSFGPLVGTVGPLAYNYITVGVGMEYNGYPNDIRIDVNCNDCFGIANPVNPVSSSCPDCDEFDLIDAGMSGSVSYNGAMHVPTSVIGVPTSVVGLTDCGWRGFDTNLTSHEDTCAYSGSTSVALPSNSIDMHTWWEYMSINHPNYNKGPMFGNTIPLSTFLTDVMILPMSGYTKICCTPGYYKAWPHGGGPCECSHLCCPGQTTGIATSWIGQPFILQERYVDNSGGIPQLVTNTLVKGSWSTVLSWLWANGMPTTIFTYTLARAWFSDMSNLTAVLQIWNNPNASLANNSICTPPSCCIKHSDNDVYMWYSYLPGRCDTPVPGCTDNLTPALNYNPLATVNCDGTPIGTYAPGWSACCTYMATNCGFAVCWECNGSSCYIDPAGIYSSQTQCLTGLPPVVGNPYPHGCDPCECIPIPGTGHTGAYFYTAQTLCELVCCGGHNIRKCDVLIIGPGEGILHYEPLTNIATHLFDDPGNEYLDISATETDIWTMRSAGGGVQIYNHAITTNPFTQSPTGSIGTGAGVMGRGLCFYSNTHHLTATDWVKKVNSTTGVPTNWFQLPNNMICTGDLLWGGSAIGTGGAGLLVILMHGTPTGGVLQHKVAKFTEAGLLVEESIIPSTILTGTTTFDSLFVDPDNDEIYGITTDGRVYHLQQNPVFQFAPLPTAQIQLQTSTGTIRGATNIENGLYNGELTCATHAIKVPVTYNCNLGAQACQDPGNGTGTFTGPMALSQCQAQCIFTYNCDPGTGMGNCASASHQLPWPTVNNSMMALYWIVDPAHGLNYNSLDDHTYENSSPVPNGCIHNGHQTWKILHLHCPTIGPNPFYYWQQFITACVMVHSIPVNMSMTLPTVRSAINNHFGYHVGIAVHTEACICYGSPCHCDPVMGSGGVYNDNWTCLVNCCGASPCQICCKKWNGTIYQLPSWLYPCECPPLEIQVACPIIVGPHNASDSDPQSNCKIGQMFSYELNRCVCQRPYPCADGNLWNEELCICIPAYTQTSEAIIEIEQEIKKEKIDREKEKSVSAGVDVEDTYGSTRSDSVQYYACASATNSIVGETQKACVPQDSNTHGSYSSLADCLNSGCGGFMKCEMGQSINGVMVEGDNYYTPIVMCCESLISTQISTGPYEYTVSGPLTVARCSSSCGDGQTWFPLYNAFGPNTSHSDSPLAYMIRELELQLAVHQCAFDRTDASWRALGYIKQNLY